MRTLQGKLKVKLLQHEEILNVQRQHWITIVIPLLVQVGLIFLFFAGMVLLLYFQYPQNVLRVTVDFTLIFLSLLATIGTYIVINWYFNFYIITNKRIIHEHFFKISGRYYEEVFLQDNIESVSRIEKNMFYDFFNIEDVCINFSRLDRIEPFIFVSPMHPKDIETIVEEFSSRMEERKTA